jgi:hypothetical protein
LTNPTFEPRPPRWWDLRVKRPLRIVGVLALLVAWVWGTIVLVSDFDEPDDDGIEAIPECVAPAGTEACLATVDKTLGSGRMPGDMKGGSK